ncbi:hypothetical protein [Acidicapsa ligni]|uniref:hypothetical protein n=1 Tax=Acidicapsa ligni TaxID=542300 RepID=UPI0021DF7D7D|nr:hypothetical protein [Acidicapsa ligni]
MRVWQRVLVGTLLVLVVAGARVYFVWKARQDPGVVKNAVPAKKLTADELTYVKEMYFATFDQAKQIEGTAVWVKAGYSLPYYPYAGGSVEFAKRVGVLPSAEKLKVQKLIKAVAPAKEDDRIYHGARQYFAVFTLEGKPGTYAAPMGYVEGSEEKIYADELFYYDDPQKIYDFWPKDVWAAVAAHTPKVGMSELQTQMAVGLLMERGASQDVGNRTVTYHAGDKKWTVTFVKDKATSVTQG